MPDALHRPKHDRGRSQLHRLSLPDPCLSDDKGNASAKGARGNRVETRFSPELHQAFTGQERPTDMTLPYWGPCCNCTLAAHGILQQHTRLLCRSCDFFPELQRPCMEQGTAGPTPPLPANPRSPVVQHLRTSLHGAAR